MTHIDQAAMRAAAELISNNCALTSGLTELWRRERDLAHAYLALLDEQKDDRERWSGTLRQIEAAARNDGCRNVAQIVRANLTNIDAALRGEEGEGE